MIDLLSLPIELICEVLDHLRPVTELPHPLHKFNPDEWDIRHWGRTLAALARTCHVLRDLAVPLLYSLYEARFQIPIHAFIDRIGSDASLQKGLKSVIARSEGPHCAKYEPSLARRALYRQWAATGGSQLEQYGVRKRQRLTTDECAQLEVWRLVSLAPNLEVLSVKNSWYGGFAHDLPPVWLFPVTLTATRIHAGLETNGWFDHLHTLAVEMENQCGLYLALFFQLPSLERLSISSVRWVRVKDSIPWPEPAGTSKVHTLELEGMDVKVSFIVRMIGYCQELKSVKCDRCHDDDSAEAELESTEVWCKDILNSLRPHSGTLRELVLEPFDMGRRDPLDPGFTHFETFRRFEALEFLEVPSMLLLGRPSHTITDLDRQTPVDWRYPLLCDVLPPNLRSLHLHMDHTYTQDDLGLGDSLMSSLPVKEDADSSTASKGLTYLTIDNMSMHHDGPLPLDFWHVQNAVRTVDSSFSYEIILDIDDIYDPGVSLEAEFNIVAHTLSTYGQKGVQMALKFQNPTLPRRVMDILGLSKEWLHTEEAEQVLFGQSYDYDAIDTRCDDFEAGRRWAESLARHSLGTFEGGFFDDSLEEEEDENEDKENWY